MKSLKDTHEKVLVCLREIQGIFEDMQSEGLGGSDFASLYMANQLIPDAVSIFGNKRYDSLNDTLERLASLPMAQKQAD